MVMSADIGTGTKTLQLVNNTDSGSTIDNVMGGSSVIDITSSPKDKKIDKTKPTKPTSKVNNGPPILDATKTASHSNKKINADTNNCDVIDMFKQLQKTVIAQAATINDKIDQKINSLESKINSLSASVDERIDNITSNIRSHIEPVVTELIKPIITTLESRIEKLERESLMLNLVVTGVPWQSNENINDIVTRICQTLNFSTEANALPGFYRISTKTQTQHSKTITSPPIVLKFWNYDQKQHFFRLYLGKKSLNLKHLGHATPSRIYINEMLTAVNKTIFIKARQLQREKRIYQSYTIRGLVVVKRTEQSKNEFIYSVEQLLSSSSAQSTNG